MEVSEVRKHVVAAIERAKKTAVEQRARADAAARIYPPFLTRVATPVFRQVAGVLKAEGYPFTVFTPAGGVRLMSDKNSDDFIELSLDTTGDRPAVIGQVKRSRGRRVFETEAPIADVPIDELTEDHVLWFLLKELEPFF
jgi:hypothetical protein